MVKKSLAGCRGPPRANQRAGVGTQPENAAAGGTRASHPDHSDQWLNHPRGQTSRLTIRSGDQDVDFSKSSFPTANALNSADVRIGRSERSLLTRCSRGTERTLSMFNRRSGSISSALNIKRHRNSTRR